MMRKAFAGDSDCVDLHDIRVGGEINPLESQTPLPPEVDPSREDRLRKAIATAEITRSVLFVLDENDVDGGCGSAQLSELKATLRSWSTDFRVKVVVFSFVAPRSAFRRLLLQSPASARGTAAARFAGLANELKASIENFASTVSHRKVSVDVHVDAESANVYEAIQRMLMAHKPHFTLVSERSDQHSLQRYLRFTSQELLVHWCASHHATVVVCRTPDSATEGSEYPVSDMPRTLLCCVNADALFAHLPVPVSTAAAMTKVGDTLVIYASYSGPDAATAAYTTDSDWFETVRSRMAATNDTIMRVVERAQRTYPGLHVKPFISELPLLDGAKRAVLEHRPHAVVVGAGGQHPHLGRTVSNALWGHQCDQVARALPSLTVVVASTLRARPS